MRTSSFRRGGATGFAWLAAAVTVVGGVLAIAAPSAAGAPAAGLQATARNFVVDTTVDGHDAHPGDRKCADTAGRCTLRSAVEEADALGAPVTVTVPAGTYRLSLGPLTVTDPAGVEIQGAGSARTTVTASGLSRDLTVKEAGSGGDTEDGAVAVLSQITLAGGSAAKGGDIDVMDANDTLELDQASVSQGFATNGGGIASAGQIEMTGSSVSDDTATDEGGGIAAANSSLRISGSSLERDSAVFGGAMFLQDCVTSLQQSTLNSDSTSSSVASSSGGAIYDSGPLDVVSDTFSSDTADGLAAQSSFGGALYESSGGVTVTGTNFSSDRATSAPKGDSSGGAVFAHGPLTVSGSTFRDDVTSGSGSDVGGAVYGDSFVGIISSTFSSDQAEGTAKASFGGAVYDAGSGADIESTVFDGNVATNGNGGALAESGDGDVLVGDTFSRNLATGAANGEGGALWAESGFMSEDSTFVQNHAQVLGGAIWEDDSASLVRTTIRGNSANQGAGIYVFWVLQATDSALLDNAATGPDSMGGAILIAGARRAARASTT